MFDKCWWKWCRLGLIALDATSGCTLDDDDDDDEGIFIMFIELFGCVNMLLELFGWLNTWEEELDDKEVDEVEEEICCDDECVTELTLFKWKFWLLVIGCGWDLWTIGDEDCVESAKGRGGGGGSKLK